MEWSNTTGVAKMSGKQEQQTFTWLNPVLGDAAYIYIYIYEYVYYPAHSGLQAAYIPPQR